MYYFHTETRFWISEQWQQHAGGHVPTPSLVEGFQNFSRGDNVNWLPSTALVPAFQVLQPEPPRRWTEPRREPAARAPPPNNNNRAGSQPNNPRTADVNTKRDSWYVGDTPLAKQVRRMRIPDAITKGGSPPAPAGGGVRCVSWHVKGSCFTNCGRLPDHVTLTGDKKEALYSWTSSAFGGE